LAEVEFHKIATWGGPKGDLLSGDRRPAAAVRLTDVVEASFQWSDDSCSGKTVT
jgi:hypothetical protein